MRQFFLYVLFTVSILAFGGNRLCIFAQSRSAAQSPLPGEKDYECISEYPVDSNDHWRYRKRGQVCEGRLAIPLKRNPLLRLVGFSDLSYNALSLADSIPTSRVQIEAANLVLGFLESPFLSYRYDSPVTPFSSHSYSTAIQTQLGIGDGELFLTGYSIQNEPGREYFTPVVFQSFNKDIQTQYSLSFYSPNRIGLLKAQLYSSAGDLLTDLTDHNLIRGNNNFIEIGLSSLWCGDDILTLIIYHRSHGSIRSNSFLIACSAS